MHTKTLIPYAVSVITAHYHSIPQHLQQPACNTNHFVNHLDQLLLGTSNTLWCSFNADDTIIAVIRGDANRYTRFFLYLCNCKLQTHSTLAEHVRNILTICNQRSYLFNCPSGKDLPSKELYTIFGALIVSQILHALSA